MMENKELVYRLNAYTEELDSLVSKLENSGFPFGDAELVYAEVSSRLKSIIKESSLNK